MFCAHATRAHRHCAPRVPRLHTRILPTRARTTHYCGSRASHTARLVPSTRTHTHTGWVQFVVDWFNVDHGVYASSLCHSLVTLLRNQDSFCIANGSRTHHMHVHTPPPHTPPPFTIHLDSAITCPCDLFGCVILWFWLRATVGVRLLRQLVMVGCGTFGWLTHTFLPRAYLTFGSHYTHSSRCNPGPATTHPH